jgi:hypothetical protein
MGDTLPRKSRFEESIGNFYGHVTAVVRLESAAARAAIVIMAVKQGECCGL